MSVESLYRKEALAYRSHAWMGKILLLRPVPLSVLVGLLSMAFVALLAAAALVPIPETVTVRGQIVPEGGLIRAYARKPGTATKLLVAEGAQVRRGDALLVLSDERSQDGRTRVQQTISAEIRKQLLALDQNRRVRSTQLAEDTQALAGKRDLLRQSVASMDAQIELVRERLASQRQVLQGYQKLMDDGFMTELGLQPKREAVLLTQADLQDKERQRLALRQELADVESALRKAPLAASSDLAGIERDIAGTARELTESDAQNEEVVTAPADGVVVSLLVKQGQQVAEARELVLIVPAGSVLQAQLCVPERAAPHIQAGDAIRLRYRAFPFQTHGQQQAAIRSMAIAADGDRSADCPAEAGQNHYLAVADLSREPFGRSGHPVTVRAGMQFDASVTIHRHTVLQTLLPST